MHKEATFDTKAEAEAFIEGLRAAGRRQDAWIRRCLSKFVVHYMFFN